MSAQVVNSSFVVADPEAIELSQLFATTTSTNDPAYLVLNALDRNDYTTEATGATGFFTGNGAVEAFSALGEDARGAGIVFTYQLSTGRYLNSTYGYLDQLIYTSSSSAGDLTNLSLFGTDDLQLATICGADAGAMMQVDPSGYIGSVSVLTDTDRSNTVPDQATPSSIASIAYTFVGSDWNIDGCWVLASTIAAEAGASLPVQSSAVNIPGQANGEWIVAYNGPAGAQGDWQAMVTAGDMIVIETPDGGGHIATCVAGSGISAMLVDNAVSEDSFGEIFNPADDGSSDDIVIPTPPWAAEEWAGVQASSVVIYRLDTPRVIIQTAGVPIAPDNSLELAPLVTATDPANKAVVQYQLYVSGNGAELAVNGIDSAADSASTAVSVSSLSQASFVAGNSEGLDTVYVRAFNGTYWGDWAPLGVIVAGSGATAANFAWTDTAISVSGSGPGEVYQGPVTYLQWQYLWSGQYSVAVAARVPNVFLKGGPADDALEAKAGSNVLDGGTGSNLLIGANGTDGGTDTFYTDARGGGVTWDTLVNFHAGDYATLWGFDPTVSSWSWTGISGVANYAGATLSADVNGDGTTDATITFAGVTMSQAQSLQVASGTVGGVGYLLFHNPGS